MFGNMIKNKVYVIILYKFISDISTIKTNIMIILCLSIN